MAYIDPGYAASQAFEQAFKDEAAQKQQALMDSLRLRQGEQNILASQADVARQSADSADRIRDKERSAVEKDIAELQPGDIPDADLVARAKKHGIPLRLKTAPAPVATPPESIAAPGTEKPQGDVTPEGTGVLATPPPGSIRFAGRPAQQEKIDMRERAQAFIDSLPEGDPRKDELKAAFEAEAAGLKVPPGYFAKTPASKTRFIFDPIKKQYMTPDGKIVTNLPNDAVVDRSADPNAGGVHFSTVQSGENYIRFNPKSGIFESQDPDSGQWKEVKNPSLATPGQTRAREDLASRVSSHFDDIEHMLDEANKANLLGPIQGRTFVDFMAGKIGTTGNPAHDELLGELRQNLSLARSGLAQLHGRGGANVGIVQGLEKNMDAGHMSYEELKGALHSMKSWVDTYGKKASAPKTETKEPATLKKPSFKFVNGELVPTGGQ